MNYTEDQYERLVEAVEAVGGEYLDDLCTYREYGATGDLVKPLFRPGCGNMAVFLVPYETPREFAGDVTGAVTGMVEVCAVCDELGNWPRFHGDVFA